MREVKLPSGAVLKIQVSPFGPAKALFQALLSELKSVKIATKEDIPLIIKDMVCLSFTSPTVEACFAECLKRCTYNTGAGDFKIDDQSFEPVERRDDYLEVYTEVITENVRPFAKSLYAAFLQASATLENIRA